MMGDHAIYHEGWIASTKVIRPPWEVVGPVNQDPVNNVTWELYDLTRTGRKPKTWPRLIRRKSRS